MLTAVARSGVVVRGGKAHELKLLTTKAVVLTTTFFTTKVVVLATTLLATKVVITDT